MLEVILPEIKWKMANKKKSKHINPFVYQTLLYAIVIHGKK